MREELLKVIHIATGPGQGLRPSVTIDAAGLMRRYRIYIVDVVIRYYQPNTRLVVPGKQFTTDGEKNHRE